MLGGGKQARNVCGVVREVTVHLEDQLGALCERVTKAGEVGGPEPLLLLAVQDVDVPELCRQAIGELAGSVRRGVVDHEDSVLGPEHVPERPEHLLDVLPLVVRGQADDGARHRRIIASMATTLPPNTDVAEQLDLLADLLELEGQDAFRVLAYRRAAARIRETGGSISQLALEGRAKQLQGIGTTIEEKIVQITERGEIEALTRRKERIPAGVVAFMHLPGLGPKTARRIWQELGLTTLEELKQAAEQQRLRTLAGGRKVIWPPLPDHKRSV